MHLYSFVMEQGHILWVMFLLGIGLGLGYDLIRTLRRISKITKEGAALGDFLYWICRSCYLAGTKCRNGGDFTFLSIIYRCSRDDFVLCYR